MDMYESHGRSYQFLPGSAGAQKSIPSRLSALHVIISFLLGAVGASVGGLFHFSCFVAFLCFSGIVRLCLLIFLCGHCTVLSL